MLLEGVSVFTAFHSGPFPAINESLMTAEVTEVFTLPTGAPEHTDNDYIGRDSDFDIHTDIPIVAIDTTFYVIHYAALSTIAVSIVCSTTVLSLHSRTSTTSFWKRKLGERLYVYLAVTDLMFSITHTCDHVIALTSLGDPDKLLCTVFAFSLFETIMAQNVVVFLSALSLWLLVKFSYKLKFGPYDVGLLTAAYGVPFFFALAFSVLGYFGSSGYWCLTDNRNPDAMILLKVLGLIQVVIAVIDIVLYSSVWATITGTQKNLKKFDKKAPKTKTQTQNGVAQKSSHEEQQTNKYRRTVKVLTLFVVAFLAQWWPTIITGIWTLFGDVNPKFYIGCVLMVNAGGVFNLIVFFVIQKTYNNKSKANVNTQSNISSIAT